MIFLGSQLMEDTKVIDQSDGTVFFTAVLNLALIPR